MISISSTSECADRRQPDPFRGHRRNVYVSMMKVDRPRIRVIDLETGGTGLDDVCEIGWQDLRPGGDQIWRLDGASTMVSTSPVDMARDGVALIFT